MSLKLNYFIWYNVIMKREIINIDKFDNNSLKNVCQNTNNFYCYQFFPEEKDEINIPFILTIPKNYKKMNKLVVDTSNSEKNVKEMICRSAVLSSVFNSSTFNLPCVVPMLPVIENGVPYYQQLAVECFNTNLPKENLRIDLQVVKVIKEVQKILEHVLEYKLDDKVILNGYSSSGAFLQRFALLHPEIVDTLFVGGSSTEIPCPLAKYSGIILNYPIGIKNISQLTGNDFNEEEYKKINFIYYTTEYEAEELAINREGYKLRENEYGQAAPKNDMTYMQRSIPKEIGENYRKCFGIEMFERQKNVQNVYQSLGYKFKDIKIFYGCNHHTINMKEVQKFIREQYDEIKEKDVKSI